MRHSGPDRHHRCSIRLKGYDYADSGAYFVTICTAQRQCLLGEVVDGAMLTNNSGDIVLMCWLELPRHYTNVKLDGFVVMPNHVHGIIWIVGAGFKPAPTGANATATRQHGLPEVVRGFKTFSSRRINGIRGTSAVPVWQRNYYERVIRSERELNAIREYITGNPTNWAEDADNLADASWDIPTGVHLTGR